MKSIEISRKKIGDGHPCFVVAEAGVNHNGSLEFAKQLVDAAVEAGADAVKFQTFKASRLISATAPKADYQKETTAIAEQQLEMVRRLEMSEDMTRSVGEHAANRRIIFLSTGFDEESIDLLDKIGVPAFKVGSGDLTALPFLEFIGRKRKPVILSTGMSYLEEVQSAVETLLAAGCPAIALLQCVSSYPADPRAANLERRGQLERARLGAPPVVVALVVKLGRRETLDDVRTAEDRALSVVPRVLERHRIYTVPDVLRERDDGL